MTFGISRSLWTTLLVLALGFSAPWATAADETKKEDAKAADSGAPTADESQPVKGEGKAPKAEKKKTEKKAAKKEAKEKKEETVTELKIKDLKKGKGAEAVAGKRVTVDYTGWLTNGKKFDSSKDAKRPFVFQLGAGQVIPGWDKGVQGMKVGGKRKLTIPPDLAYGPNGAGGVIPPNATLVFEVELLKVE